VAEPVRRNRELHRHDAGPVVIQLKRILDVADIQ